MHGRKSNHRLASLRTVRLLLLFALATTLAACSYPDDTQSYMLVFVDEDDAVRVRWSITGDEGTWEDGVGGAGFTSNLGVGAAADPSGILRIVPFMNAQDTVEFFWGLGALFEDESSAATNDPADSAPSAIHLEGGDWLIAYTRGTEVVLRVYNHEERDWLNWNVAPLDDACNNTAGRPALARLDDTIVMAGIWGTNVLDHRTWVQVGQYDPESPIRIDWGSCYFIEQPSRTGDRRLVRNLPIAPSLTHDHSNFYVSMVEEYDLDPQEGDDTALDGYEVMVYRSTDPNDHDSWTVHGGYGYTVSEYTRYVNIAGRSDGSVLAAVIADDRPSPRVFRWGGSNPSPDSVFGDDPAAVQFALVAVGLP
jgi:hypothetical protein